MDRHIFAILVVLLLNISVFCSADSVQAENTYGGIMVGTPVDQFSAEMIGSVNIILGSKNGATNSNNQFLYEGVDNPGNMGDQWDYYGDALATGDFNNDGLPDLVVGVPNSESGAGKIIIYHGKDDGIYTAGDREEWNQCDVMTPPCVDTAFGKSLGSGDFNNDGFDDLVVGVHTTSGGVVYVVLGSTTGLDNTTATSWSQGSNGIAGASEAGDNFGNALTTGDFNNDGFADLAIAVIDEDIGVIVDAGAVHIIYGSKDGLTATDNQLWYQGYNGLLDTAEASDNFGKSLASGDFNNDGFADLAIGIGKEDVSTTFTNPPLTLTITNAGATSVIYGSDTGLTAVGNQYWHQGLSKMVDSPQKNDYFGHSLTVGDFDNDGYADLAIGVEEEDIATTTIPLGEAGAVNVIYGSGTGLNANRNEVWNTEILGLSPIHEFGRFGSAQAAGDLNGDGYDDLAVGEPWQDLTGRVHVVYGSATGLTAVMSHFFRQGANGILGEATGEDHFGTRLIYFPPVSTFPWPAMMPAILSKGQK